MLMEKLSPALGSSLYHQVYHIIRSGILSGRHARGSYLASETRLATEFKVSRATIRSALQALREEGLVERQHGRGTLVVHARKEPEAAQPRRHGIPLSLSAVELREFEIVKPAADVAALLDISTDENIIRYVRVRLRDDVPVRVITSFVPLAVAPRFSRNDVEATQTFVDALKRSGVSCHSIDYSCGALLADHGIASVLRLKVGAPVIDVLRTLRDDRLTPIAIQQVYIPPELDRIRIVVNFDGEGPIAWSE